MFIWCRNKHFALQVVKSEQNLTCNYDNCIYNNRTLGMPLMVTIRPLSSPVSIGQDRMIMPWHCVLLCSFKVFSSMWSHIILERTSGIRYGWNSHFHFNSRWWEDQKAVIYTTSLYTSWQAKPRFELGVFWFPIISISPSCPI